MCNEKMSFGHERSVIPPFNSNTSHCAEPVFVGDYYCFENELIKFWKEAQRVRETENKPVI